MRKDKSMAEAKVRHKVVAGKVWVPECEWWRVWAEDLNGRRWLGEYLTEKEAEQVMRRAQRQGVPAAERVWEALQRDRILHWPAVFYYPLAERQTGESIQVGTWHLECRETFEGEDHWEARCGICQKRAVFTTRVPPKHALWPFRLPIEQCDHVPPKREPTFFDDYPEYMREDLMQRYDP